MGVDTFVVSGVLEELKRLVIQLNKKVMDVIDEKDIDWEKVQEIAEEIENEASLLQCEIEGGLSE